MLHDFLTKERDTILAVAKQKALKSHWARIASDAVGEEWGVFYDDLTGRLMTESDRPVSSERFDTVERDTVAAKTRAKDYLQLGYAISEVVQSYIIIYQAITDSAERLRVEITVDEFQKLNLSLDTAVAEVVKEFERVQTGVQDRQSDAKDQKEAVRLGTLAHELRNSLQSATISLQMIEEGIMDVRSKTGAILRDSLKTMGELIDQALAAARLRIDPDIRLQKIRVFEVLSEVNVTAGFQARARELSLRMQGDSDLYVFVDRHLLTSAVSNLVQNALKFSKAGGTIQVRARASEDRVLIEVEDECGGLPDGKIEELFNPGVQKSADKTGIGLGLTISRQALERNKGKLTVRDLPGKGCIFTIDLPKVDAYHSNGKDNHHSTKVRMHS
jgi:signal transduction histidine kinase